MKEWYVLPVSVRSKSARAACTSAGFEKRSIAVSASTFDATTIPSCPMLMPAEAEACQVWGATPGTKVAVVNPIVGTAQLTSPTSVEADGALRSTGRKDSIK